MKLGKSADGRLFMLAYPDVYKKVSPVSRGQKIAKAFGYTLGPEHLKALDDTTGLPIWLDDTGG